MPGGAVLQYPRRRIDDRVTNSGEVRCHTSSKELVEAPEQLPWPLGMEGEGSERCPHLPHGRGGSESVADDVADGHRNSTVRYFEGVVPIAADFERIAAGLVQRREGELRTFDEACREERSLKPDGNFALLGFEGSSALFSASTLSVMSIPVGWRNRTPPASSVIGCMPKSTMRSPPSATQ